MKVLAILVNFHCSELIHGAVESLLAQDYPDLQIHVVDNSQDATEAQKLSSLLPSGIRLTISDRNLGFGAACNLAFADSESPLILLLNPDARLFPGALNTMVGTLSADSGLGAVGPMTYWDLARQWMLPPSTFPSRKNHFLGLMGSRLQWLNKYLLNRFRKRSISYWQAENLVSVDALSGGLVLLRRTAVENSGGLFDPRFFMYWEDSDLMQRLQDSGWRLATNPEARAVHLYEHSGKKGQMISAGWPIYEAKHFSSPFWKALQKACTCFRVNQDPENFIDIFYQKDKTAFEIKVPREFQKQWLLEYSPSPSFFPAIGRIGTGEIASLTHELAQRFSVGVYYLRIGGLENTKKIVSYRLRSLRQ
jgi:GT2 family glycosyltransferase